MKHVHAELMAEYAKDAMETDKPWERWEIRLENDNEWTAGRQGLMYFSVFHEYRRKPKSSRERFEEWWVERENGKWSLDRNPHSGPADYLSLATESAWGAWQESERQAANTSDKHRETCGDGGE